MDNLSGMEKIEHRIFAAKTEISDALNELYEKDKRTYYLVHKKAVAVALGLAAIWEIVGEAAREVRKCR